MWQLSFTNLWNRLRRHCLDFRLSLQLMIKLCIFEMLSNYRCDLTSGFIQTSPGCLGNWCSRSARFSPEVSLYAFQVHRGFVLLIFMLLLSLNTINIVVTLRKNRFAYSFLYFTRWYFLIRFILVSRPQTACYHFSISTKRIIVVF